MDTVLTLWRTVWAGLLSGWQMNWLKLNFDYAAEALWMASLGLAITISILILVGIRKNRPGKAQIVLPAVLPFMRRSLFSGIRFLPFLLFLFGLGLFFVALADPFLSFTRQEVSYPGRRVAVLIDASGSMNSEFKVNKLKVAAQESFYTATAAAEYFIRMRMRSRYLDLMCLIEFGNEAYVITPFTTDYENILLSVRLIADPSEWKRFKDKGTRIARAINQAVQLFETFGFLEASGNIMVIFSDGDDSDAFDDIGGRRIPLDDILAEARKTKIPIYFVRTGYGKFFQLDGQQNLDKKSGVVNRVSSKDILWGQAVEKTGGKFYAAADEAIILEAIDEINRTATGEVRRRQYQSKQPYFVPFALAALACWTVALAFFGSFKYFRKFP